MSSPKIQNIAFVVIFLLTVCKNAYGYIDPGAGSSTLQIIVAILVMGFFVLKLYFRKFKSFIINLFFGKKKK